MKDFDISDLDMETLESLTGKSEKKQSLEEIIAPYLVKWKWFVLSVLVAIVLAFIYLRYTPKVYQINSSIILKDAKDNRMRPTSGLFAGMDMMGVVNNVDNEIEVLRSKTIIKGTVDQLDLHTSYIVEGRVKSSDLYRESPLIVKMEQVDLDNLKSPVMLTAVINKDQSVDIAATFNGKKTNTKIKQMPALYKTPAGILTVSFRAGKAPNYGVPIQVVIRKPMSMVPYFRSGLAVAPTSKTTSVLNLAYTTTETQKGIDFLNALVGVYNMDATADKNKEALNTQEFIDGRLAIINNELGSAERQVEDYKRSQGLTDITSDVQMSLQKGSQYEQKLVEVSTQLNLVDYLDTYINEQRNRNKLIPSNVGIEDPTLAATINEYNRQILERDRLLRTNTESNPVIQKLDGQIEGLRAGIESSIASVKQGLSIARRDAQSQVNYYKSQTGAAPTQERQFTEIAREQQIKSSLFLMLLQKREENALSLAATAPKAKVLDEATVGRMIKPKRMMVLMIALFLGLLIPALIIFLKDLLHFRIESRADIDRYSNIPSLGEIPVSASGNIAVVANENRETEEAFRMLRTNLLFTLGKDKKVVVVTSTEPKEGKTFIAINTAISLSLLDKKVLLMGMDLRLPRLSEYLNIDTGHGMSQFLSGNENNILDIVQPSGINPNLSVISAGAIPPNPAELIARTEFEKGMEVLRQKFDYIIIDSAPVSLVTDTIVASRVADATMYVCRANYSRKNNLRFANDLSDKKMLPNMGLVVNDVSNFHSGYGTYGSYSSYGYGYGYGYNKDNKKKKRIL